MYRLLVGAIVAIVAVAALPYGRQAWREYRFEQRRDAYLERKDKEIACLNGLRAGGLDLKADVTAQIDQCKQKATDPDTGRYDERFR